MFTDTLFFVARLQENYRHRFWIQVTYGERIHMRKLERKCESFNKCETGKKTFSNVDKEGSGGTSANSLVSDITVF